MSPNAALKAEDTPQIVIEKADPHAPAFVATGAASLAIRAGTTITVAGAARRFENETRVTLPGLITGTDYKVTLDRYNQPVVVPYDDLPGAGAIIGGFHFAPGGNASARSGGDEVPAINPGSVWDRFFRPACADARGMTRVVTPEAAPFWVDIYLTARDHATGGSSRLGTEILDHVTFADAEGVARLHGKRLLSFFEFAAAAFGVTERSSDEDKSRHTALSAARTSKHGLMQATGQRWVWGTDGDPDDPRASVFGGSWLGRSHAGSRCADLACWPDYSYDALGVRLASDHLSTV